MVTSFHKNGKCDVCSKKNSIIIPIWDALGLNNIVDDIYLCADCINTINQAKQKVIDDEKKELLQIEQPLYYPRSIKQKLDKFVIAQENTKIALSVGVYNHHKRVNEKALYGSQTISKDNLLFIGPTGVGKTYLMQTISKILNIPIAIEDAAPITEAGYIGEKVECLIKNLAATAGFDKERTEKGIIYIDEIDKKAKPGHVSLYKDVSGEGVQKGLLKLIEGKIVEVHYIAGNAKRIMKVDTKNILFIFGGAFVGLEAIIRRRLANKQLGFGAKINTPVEKQKILEQVTSEDLIQYGLIPELVGRIPIISVLHDLDTEHLVKILNESEDSPIRQYQQLFRMDGNELSFTKNSIKAIAKKAITFKKGARGLREIMFKIMLDFMYQLPGACEAHINIDEDFVNNKKPAEINLLLE